MYRGVYGVALGKVAHGGVVGCDVGQIAAAVEEGLGVAVLSSQLLGLLHIGVHLRECLEVAVYKLLGLVATYLQTLCQAKDGYAVYYAEVGTLGLGALVAANVFNLLLVYACGGGGVYVVALAESLNHVLVAREVSHDAQLYLRVVGREEEAARLGYETLAYLLAVLAAYRDVLQVRVGRREAPRGCNRLVEGGVYVVCAWVY